MVDPQLKRGLLDACVLSLLRRGGTNWAHIIQKTSPHTDPE